VHGQVVDDPGSAAHDQSEQTDARRRRRPGEPVSCTETVSSKILEKASYLFLYETSVIVAAGILRNYLGLTLS
jgi:hypothetical protein